MLSARIYHLSNAVCFEENGRLIRTSKGNFQVRIDVFKNDRWREIGSIRIKCV